MRDYNITKHKGNTHYTVNVTDSYGRQKGNFFRELQDCYDFVYSVWKQETPLTNKEVEQDLLGKAIKNCIKLEEEMWSAYHSGEITI
tara:strand:+ start:130 stop:390 length:261 start_codon:yes stop_codon:yes gene_type:complete